MSGKKNFLIIIAWIVLRLDVEETELSRVKASAQIFAGKGMSVIPAAPARLRNERVLARASGGNHRRAFFHRAVHLRRHVKSMPRHQLGHVAIVCYLVDDYMPFLYVHHRS